MHFVLFRLTNAQMYVQASPADSVLLPSQVQPFCSGKYEAHITCIGSPAFDGTHSFLVTITADPLKEYRLMFEMVRVLKLIVRGYFANLKPIPAERVFVETSDIDDPPPRRSRPTHGEDDK